MSRTSQFNMRISAALAVIATAATAMAQNSAPVVSNVTAAQRNDASKIVDIRYNLADADGDACTITVQASNNGVIDLGHLGFPEAEAYGINNAGKIVGHSRLATGQARGFFWQNGQMIDLGTLGGQESQARAINNAGQVVGFADVSGGGAHPFLWQNGVMTDLGFPGGTVGALALDISDSGVVVGYATRPGFIDVPILWDASGVHELPSVSGMQARALEINSDGVAVGFAWSPNGQTRPLLWRDGIVQDLNDFVPEPYRGRLGGASAINDLGQVLVGADINNDFIAELYLLTPVPEPATLAMVLAPVAIRAMNSIRKLRLDRAMQSRTTGGLTADITGSLAREVAA